MNVEHINPFIEASQAVFKQMAGTEVKLGRTFIRESPYDSNSIVIIIGVTGKIRGQIIFEMDKKTALKLTSAMMGGSEVGNLDEVAKSAISELTNMIIGNTATILYNKGIKIEITPPSILVGQKMQISLDKVKAICIPLELENGDIISINIAAEE